MFERSQVKEGMVVRSQDGEKLGRVFAVAEDAFHIEKGLFFPKDYLVRFSEVAGLRDGELVLAHGRDSLRRLGSEERDAASSSTGGGHLAGTGGGAGVGPGAMGLEDTGVSAGTRATTGSAIPMPGVAMGATGMTASPGSIGTDLGRDTLDPGGASQREREVGQVRVTKEVVSEEQELRVPVRKERARVERREVSPGRPAMNASFRDETLVVPLREEQVEVEKRARITEEVVIHKDAVEEERGRPGYTAPDDDPLRRS